MVVPRLWINLYENPQHKFTAFCYFLSPGSVEDAAVGSLIRKCSDADKKWSRREGKLLSTLDSYSESAADIERKQGESSTSDETSQVLQPFTGEKSPPPTLARN